MSRRDSRTFAVVVSVLALVLAGTTIWLGPRRVSRTRARARRDHRHARPWPTRRSRPANLRIGTAERQVSGIETAPLAAAEADATIEVYGVVVDLKALVEARGRLVSQDGAVRALRTAATLSEAEYQRAAALFKDDRNVSEKAMLAAEAQWKTDRERLSVAEAEVRSLRETLRATWGAPARRPGHRPRQPRLRRAGGDARRDRADDRPARVRPRAVRRGRCSWKPPVAACAPGRSSFPPRRALRRAPWARPGSSGCRPPGCARVRG